MASNTSRDAENLPDGTSRHPDNGAATDKHVELEIGDSCLEVGDYCASHHETATNNAAARHDTHNDFYEIKGSLAANAAETVAAN